MDPDPVGSALFGRILTRIRIVIKKKDYSPDPDPHQYDAGPQH